MDTQQILAGLPGLPLDRALALLEGTGISPKILFTSDPRHQRTEGTIRVLRASEAVLVVARFQDQMPTD